MTAVSSVSSCMHWIRGCIIILLLTILDQGSKSLVLAQLKDQPDISLIPGVLQLIIRFLTVSQVSGLTAIFLK